MPRIRITGGICRSRLIEVAAAPGLRPTPDRVRETLFNWLGQDLHGLNCLDLFAGSGILGLEAASRGAAGVTLVERDRAAFSTLKHNAESLGLAGVEVHCGDALKFAASAARRYDVIFLDPPYRQGWLERMAPQIEALAAPEARIYVEAECELNSLGGDKAWQPIRHGRAGQVFYHLFVRD